MGFNGVLLGFLIGFIRVVIGFSSGMKALILVSGPWRPEQNTPYQGTNRVLIGFNMVLVRF